MCKKVILLLGKVGHWIFYIAVIGALVGCTPKLPHVMSEEDLQTCDDTAAIMNQNSDITKSVPTLHPNLVQPSVAEVSSPLSGSILPYGEPVIINFKLPPANTGVIYRHYRITVNSITGLWPIDWVGDQFSVVSPSPTDLQETWTPPGSGKFIIYIWIRNIETESQYMGFSPETLGEELLLQSQMSSNIDIYTGPYSLAHVCVQIDNPKEGDIIVVEPGTIAPLETIATIEPTFTKTLTFTQTIPTFTATFTPTLTMPTFTSTFTLTPLKPTFTSTFTPTPQKPKPVVNCSKYSDASSCKANHACIWKIPPTGGPGSCVSK